MEEFNEAQARAEWERKREKFMREEVAYALTVAGKNLMCIATAIRDGAKLEEVYPLIKQVETAITTSKEYENAIN